MTATIRPVLAGNWKMNGLSTSLDELRTIAEASAKFGELDLVLCVPATLVSRASDIAASSPLAIGGEDCHAAKSGAHTGDISAEMLKDAGATHVIVGHSERRTDHGETSEAVHAKAQAAIAEGLIAIICIGETRAEREAGETLDVLSRQIAASVPDTASGATTLVAYEPVWAIGTGLTPTALDIAVAHAHIRGEMTKRIGSEAVNIPLLYGGSVKPSNARELMAVDNVDGALVGGASLKSADFLAIAEAY